MKERTRKSSQTMQLNKMKKTKHKEEKLKNPSKIKEVKK